MVVELKKLTKEERLERMRHSASHIMAEAVLSLFAEARLGIGPPIDTGFYYDFELPRPLTPDDLPAIEAKMRERIASDVSFIHSQATQEEARRRFAHPPDKLELIGARP
ncbi:MAG: threonine--tRNA ligase, partial [Dehalococcoidia bacterium]